MRLIQGFFDGRESLNYINQTFITLIPKMQRPSNISQFRPVAGINTICKIITKLILELISNHHTSFTKGWFISNNYSSVKELIRGLNQKSTLGRACISTDIIKAFDSIDWDAI